MLVNRTLKTEAVAMVKGEREQPGKWVAIYVRVSSKNQDTKSQLPDLERWAAAQEEPVKWYKDKFTGKTMDRPGWSKLDADIHASKVSRVVCWRLDRLGRTAKGLTALFEDLQDRKVGLVSLKEGLDLSTPAGRLMAHVLASVAQYETEVRAERIMAGQAAARAAGKKWGGSPKGRRVKVTDQQARIIQQMRQEKVSITAIAKATGLSRPTVYSVLAGNGQPVNQ
jgi:DNA invertase Pin-like site-specific DNA recombinase